MPCCSASCLQIQQYYKNNYSIPTAELPWQGCWGRLPVSALFRRQPAACLRQPAACLRQPALPAPSRPGDADGIHPSAQGSPMHSSKLEGQNRSSRRPWSSKSEIPHELESKPPEVLNRDQSKRGNLKHESKPELRVEA